ncbi:MAG: helix-turn-helix transcriptional regulator [Acidobacteriota bacterium]
MDTRVNVVISYLGDNLHQELDLDYLAQLVNLSSSRLRHLFKDQTGLSFATYIRLLRMQKAKEMLENTFLNVKEIMFTTGIKDESHFVRNFKQMYGLPPGRYRVSSFNPHSFNKLRTRRAANAANK